MIMKLRQMAVAFLINEEREVLLLQKGHKDTLLAGFLVPIGGHMENNEINDPEKACFREIEEETGLKKASIKKLNLKYMMVRNSQNQEVRIQYVYFGRILKNNTLIASDEGSLKWVNWDEVTNRNISETSKKLIEHYNDNGSSNEEIYVGTMKSLNGKPTITWGVLQDWEE